MKRVFSFFILFSAVCLLGYGIFFQLAHKHVSSAPVLVSPQTKEQQGTQKAPEPGKPVRLDIPKLGISAPIEYVGMDAKGNMDVPKQHEDVAWFELGYLPGTAGNAVIAGHLDTKTGAPAVFYHLGSLETGDTIAIMTDEGQKLTFTVIAKKIYSSDDFPLVAVFGPANRPRLNLITCEGTFNTTRQNYSHRTVVYSELSS